MSIYLFIFEFGNYFVIKTKSELLIDNSKSSSSLKINVDLTMHRIPCYILNMDISDFTGAHTSNVQGTLTKTSLDANGKKLKEDKSAVGQKHEEKFTNEDVAKAFNENQGCRLTGSFSVMRLPGNFHVASHTFAPILRDFREKGQIIHFNLTHTIYIIFLSKMKKIFRL